MTRATTPVARVDNVTQRYARTMALDAVSVELPAACMVGLIGPDGVGKSTLLSIVAGGRQIQSGRVAMRTRLRSGHERSGMVWPGESRPIDRRSHWRMPQRMRFGCCSSRAAVPSSLAIGASPSGTRGNF
jgi:ABC-type branched-subunit amino acid transport system ATPase component